MSDEIAGLNEWSPNEIKVKDEAVKTRGEIFADNEQLFDLAETSYEIAALNQILAWLDFPYQQRAYLDCLIAIAGGSEKARFSATNVEVARQLRTGKNSKDESLAKWVTRQKKKFQQWQARKQFNLVEITDGWFDAKKQKNTPASYILHIVEWAKRAVANAKAKSRTAWRKGIDYRRIQLRAIRRAVYDLLQSLPECPPLKLKIRTLSVEDNFDRRSHSVISFVEKNIQDLYRVDVDHTPYVDYMIAELQKLREKPAGAIGNLITPKEKDPDKKAKVWQAALRGNLSALSHPSPEEEIIDYTSMSVDTEVEEPAAHRTDISSNGESDNYTFDAETTRNPLNPLSVGRTFLSEDDASQKTTTQAEERSPETNYQEEVSPLTDTITEEDMEMKKVQLVVGIWQTQINNRVPYPDREAKNAGAWEISWGDVTGIAQRTEGALNFAILKTAYDRISLEKLKPVFVEYVMARVRWWKHNVPTNAEEEKLEKFKQKLTNFLEIPDLNSL